MASDLESISIELDGIGHALSDQRVCVPIYQRSYAWEERHVQEFLDDISGAMSGGGAEYFLGSVVLMSEQGANTVVDGQQRLATTAIVLASARDYFLTKGDDERAATIEQKFLFSRSLRTRETLPRLTLNESDHSFFLNRILLRADERDLSVEPTKVSHHRLLNAFALASRQIEKLTAITANPVDDVLDWLEYVEQKAKIIKVTVPNDTNAFTIFETLNDRGLELAISDLLKNNLFHVAGDRIKEVQSRWIAMVGALEAADSEELTVTYIRHLWSSKHGSTRERDLYQNIKKKTNSKKASLDLAEDLQRNSRIYTALLNPAHEFWTPYGATARQDIDTLLLLKMVQIRPLLLATVDVLDAREVKKCFRLFVSWAARFLITGGVGGGTLETHYCERAKEIRSKKVSTAKHLSEAMAGIVPADSVFAAAFAVATVSKAFLARYYLATIENYLRKDKGQELIANRNEEVLNLEHVLPETPSTKWRDFSDDEAEAFLKRIGNLTLLGSAENSVIGNDSFDEKRKAYRASQLVITQRIARFSTWAPKNVDARQQELAAIAVKAWPLRI